MGLAKGGPGGWRPSKERKSEEICVYTIHIQDLIQLPKWFSCVRIFNIRWKILTKQNTNSYKSLYSIKCLINKSQYI